MLNVINFYNKLKMKIYLIFFLSLFLIVSCQKDIDEEILKVEIDTRSVNVGSESTFSGDIIRDHFHNNKESDPLLMLPEEYREEFSSRLNYFTDNFNEELEFSSILEKVENKYCITKDVNTELQLFYNGLIASIEDDAYSVYSYYNKEVAKNRNLSPLESFQVTTVIKISQALWDVTCIQFGIANSLQINTRGDRDPLCDEVVDALRNHTISTIGGVIGGVSAGGLIGGAIGGPIGAGVGTVVGGIVGGIIGWKNAWSRRGSIDRLYAECEKCLPPTSIDVVTAECSLTADFTPVGAGSMVTSLLWESDQTTPSSATGSRTQTQTFSHIPGSGTISFKITSTCMFDGNSIMLDGNLSAGNIENRVVSVPYNAFYVVGNDAIKIPITNGQVGSPVTETYQYSGLAIDNPDDYSFEFLGNVVNGSVVSTTSNSITIRWYPSNLNDYILSQFVWGSFKFRVTNNCPGGQSKVITLTSLINGSENEI
ncbi:MAG: hypothetical protein ACJATI_003646 [Halioglobus sp.]|jgi:hypothetical protein